MLTDALTLVSSDQAVTATAVSEDVIDLLQNRDIGEGEQLFMAFTCKVAAVSAGATTVTFQVVTDDNTTLASPTVIAQSQDIPKASLVIGHQVFVPIPPQIASKGERYLGAQYTVAVANLSAGTWDASIVRNVGDSKKFYPSGYTVS